MDSLSHSPLEATAPSRPTVMAHTASPLESHSEPEFIPAIEPAYPSHSTAPRGTSSDAEATSSSGSANLLEESTLPSTTSATERAPAPPWKPPHSSLFSLPPDLPAMRARFFSLDTPLTLSQDQFKEYWPFVDNIYVKNKERPVTLDNTRSAYYYCRLWKKSEYVGVSSAIRQRKKHCRATIACPMKFKAIFYGDSHVKFERLGDHVHNHDLDYVDSIKRNSAVRNIAAAEVSKGYKPCDVARNLRESTRADNLRALKDAGGSYICLKDVHNAGRLKTAAQSS
ncbi:hypothetical protein FQN54_006217 [Arachnomyces sp. PD_36]|nr:hypothetical protein FQN54_006217 [Arachnomyces sp. PD_36]